MIAEYWMTLIDLTRMVAETECLVIKNLIQLSLNWNRRLNISLVFTTQSYFKEPKYVRRNIMHFFSVMRIPNKRELQQIRYNHSSDIDFKDFLNLYRKCTEKPYSFLVIDATLTSDNP